jgi:hypothetical protein
MSTSPNCSAAVPSTGPNSDPATAKPSAVPIIAPRRSTGAVATSHASDPLQHRAPAAPCTKRETSSTSTVFPSPNATLEAASSPSPSRSAPLTPTFRATQIAGTAATSVPAGYAPASTPAAALVSPRSRA